MACSCNTSGSIENFCDTHTGQCPCKMGVEGLQCDECVEGFYGLSSDGCQGKLNISLVFHEFKRAHTYFYLLTLLHLLYFLALRHISQSL